MIKQKFTILIFTLGLFFPLSFVFAGTILSSHKYAWSNNIGYINFANVIVNDNALSGYAWSINSGLINFAPAQSGVKNDGAGHLSGSAWGEQLGYIDFSGVYVNPLTGKFSGTAAGTLAGTITFDCPNYCDVETDWRQTVFTVAPPSGSGHGDYNLSNLIPVVNLQVNNVISNPVNNIVPSINFPNNNTNTNVLNPSRSNDPIHLLYNKLGLAQPDRNPKSEYVESFDAPITILPNQSGLLTYDFNTEGSTIVQLPQGLSDNAMRIEVSTKATTSVNNGPSPFVFNSSIFHIVATDSSGNEVHSFTKPLKITLSVPKSLVGEKDLGVYWHDISNHQWILVPGVVFFNTSVMFYVNHLTDFAILKIKNLPASISITENNTNVHNQRSFKFYFLIIFFIIFIFYLNKKYNYLI